MAIQIEPGIFFEALDVTMPDLDLEKIEKWVELTCLQHQKQPGEIQYIFCSDDKIIEVNNKYLQHDYYTDIITFDYCEDDIISGDLFISLDTVKSNSDKYRQEYHHELLRVIIHGVLHLCGLKDKSEEESAQMRLAEEQALTIYNTL